MKLERLINTVHYRGKTTQFLAFERSNSVWPHVTSLFGRRRTRVEKHHLFYSSQRKGCLWFNLIQEGFIDCVLSGLGWYRRSNWCWKIVFDCGTVPAYRTGRSCAYWWNQHEKYRSSRVAFQDIYHPTRSHPVFWNLEEESGSLQRVSRRNTLDCFKSGWVSFLPEYQIKSVEIQILFEIR